MHGSLIKQMTAVGVPILGTQEETADPTVYVRLQLLNTTWQWFVTEADVKEDDTLFFGYVCGFEYEWGYFRLSELKGAGPLIYDCEFKPMPFSELKAKYGL